MLRRRSGISRVANYKMLEQLVDFLETNFQKIYLKNSQLADMRREFESALYNHSEEVNNFADALDSAIRYPNWDSEVKDSLLELKSNLKDAVPHLKKSYNMVSRDSNIFESLNSISGAHREVRKITTKKI